LPGRPAGFRLDLDKALLFEPCPDRLCDGVARHQEWPDVGVPRGGPPGRELIVSGHQRAAPPAVNAGIDRQNQYVAARNRLDAPGRPCPDRSGQNIRKSSFESHRQFYSQGNVIEQDGKLYVVLTAENIHPGKGTPSARSKCAEISDGVKVSERYKTTDQVEKATIEDHNFNYLYEDGDGFHFMNADTYDQVQVPKDVIGTAAPYLQENMTVKLSLTASFR